MDSDSYLEEEDYAGFGEAAAEKPSFDRADLKYAIYRLSSQYKEEAIRHVKDLPITGRLKDEYYNCIFSLFAPENVLANNGPRVPSLLKSDPLKRHLRLAELYIKKVAACSSTRGDRESFDVGGVERAIFMVYESFLTRTLGSDRENIRNAVLISESVSRSERPRESISKPKKSGIINLRGD